MRAACTVEWLKLRRSRVPGVTAAALLLLPAAMAALFLAMAGNDRGDAMSLKAGALVTREGWLGYLDADDTIYASAGLLGMGVVVAWCFGREYADRTVVSLYASATPASPSLPPSSPCWRCGLLRCPWRWSLSPARGGLVVGLGVPDDDALLAVVRVALLSALTGLGAHCRLVRQRRPRRPAGLRGSSCWSRSPRWPRSQEPAAGFPTCVPGLWAVASSTPTLAAVPGWHLLLVPCWAAVLGALTIGWWRRAQLA